MSKVFGFLLLNVLLMNSFAWAGAVITYHGRILDAQDRPLEVSNVSFRIRIYSPNPGKCLLYEETRTLNMVGSGGVFVIPIGDGSGNRSVNDPGIVMEKIFSNDPAISFNVMMYPKISCNSGVSYTPQTLDQRQLVISFDDGTGTGEQVLPATELGYVPLAVNAYDSQNIGGVPASSLLRLQSGSAAPLTTGQYNELLNVANGSSSQYEKSGQLGGHALPALSVGQVLGWDGSTWTAMTASSGAGTESDPSVKDFAKNDLPMCGANTFLKDDGANGFTCAALTSVSVNTASATQVNTRNLYVENATPNRVRIQAPSSFSDYTLILPTSAGSSGQLLSMGNSGQMEWIAAPTGGGGLSGPVAATDLAPGTADGQVLRYNGTQWSATKLNYIDLVNGTGASPWPTGSCTSGQVITWLSVADGFSCQDLVVSSTNISNGSIGASQLGAGAVTTAKIGDGQVTNAKIASVEVGKITSGAGQYFTYKPNDVVCTDGQALVWNTNRWVCGTVSSAGGGGGVPPERVISAGNGLIGGGDLSVDRGFAVNTGTGASQIPQLDASGKLLWSVLPAGLLSTGSAAAGEVTGPFSSLAIANAVVAPKHFVAGTVAGQVHRYDGSQWAVAKLNYADLVNANGVSPWPAASCTAGQVITWVSLTDGFNCTNLVVSASSLADSSVTSQKIQSLEVGKITSASGQYFSYKPDNMSCADGQVLKWNTDRWECGTDNSGGGGGGATLVDGTVAGQFLRWDGTAWSGSTNGSSLISLNAAQLSSGTIPGARLPALTGDVTSTVNTVATTVGALRGRKVSTIVPSDGQVLKWNNTTSEWAPSSDTVNAGTVTSVATGSGLTGGPITSTGTISLATSGVGAGTYRSVTVDTFGRVTAGTNPTALTDYGINLTSGRIFVGNASNVPTAVAVSGDTTMTNAGVVTVAKIQGRDVTSTAPTSGQVLKWNGTAWTPSTDTSNSGTMTSVDTGAGLTGGPITTSGTISLDTSGVSAGSYRSVTVDIYGRVTAGANPTTLTGYGVTLPSANIFVGNASSVPSPVPLTGDASLTNAGALTVTRIQGRDIATTAPASGQVLKYNGTAWAPAAVTSGTVTSVATGTGLTGGPITSSGTISLDTSGVTAGVYRSVTVDAYGRVTDGTNPTTLPGYGISLPSARIFVGNATNVPTAVAVSGDVTLSNTGLMTVTQLQTRDVASTAPTTGQVLKWSGTAWAPATDVSNTGTVTSVATGTGLTGGPITSSGTISLAASGVTAGTYRSVEVDAYGRVTDASNPTTLTGYGITLASGRVFVGNASNVPTAVAMSGDISMSNTGVTTVTQIQGRDVAATAPGSGQVLKWNGTAWAPGADTDTGITSVATGSGLTGGTITSTGTISIASGGVTATHLAADSVTAAKIADGAVGNAALAANAVNSAKIADGTIVAADLAADSVTSAKIDDGTIVAADLATSAVTSAKILDGTIVAADLATDSVTAAKIADGAVGAAALASNAVTTVKIADDAVTSAKIAANTIVSGNIAAGTITADRTNTSTCSTANRGMTRMSGTTFQYCDGTAWAAVGSGTACGSRDHLEIWQETSSSGSGTPMVARSYTCDDDDRYLKQCQNGTVVRLVRFRAATCAGSGSN